jgi:carboxylate-amine ligase
MWFRPGWARWATGGRPYSLGVEEEVMLLRPDTWQLAQAIDEVLPQLPSPLVDRVSAETHAAALELATGVHATPASAIAELAGLRSQLVAALEPLGLRTATAGTHPSATWQETRVSEGARYQLLYASLRELARREPTFALHVHVGVGDPETAVSVANRLRAHVPLLLALSANSPFWQGRDTGLASARTTIFGAFPRVGLPRAFQSYDDWVRAVTPLIAAEAIPEPTFLWWDVRLQPKLGTIEIRVMDAQSQLGDVGALVALVQAVVRLEAEEGYASAKLVQAPEVLDENRFIAARDGIRARLVHPELRRRVPVRDLVRDLVAAARPHAAALGAGQELAQVERLLEAPGAERQRIHGGDLETLTKSLSDAFPPLPAAGTAGSTAHHGGHGARVRHARGLRPEAPVG